MFLSLAKIAKITLLFILFLNLSSTVNAIAGGHDSKIRRHKWQLSLRHENKHFCGAVLISTKWALTSAHCIELHSTNLSVRAGSTSRSSRGQILEVANVTSHPNYNNLTHNADIAVLRLTGRVDLDIAWPQELPYSSKDVVEHSPITITGWGRQSPNGSYPDTLQMIQVTVMSREKCQTAYPSTVINLNMFCGGWLGGLNNTACEGDYGGPAMIYCRLEGIISWGKGCGVSQWPTVFTRVANYVDWIQEITGIERHKLD